MANKFEIEPLPFAPGEVNINLGILETALSAEALSNFGTVCLTLGKTRDGDLKRTFWSPKILREIPEDFEPTLNNKEGLLQLKPKGHGRLLSWLYTKTIEPSDLYLVNEKLTGIKYVGKDGLLRHARSEGAVDMEPFDCHPDNKTDETFHVKILDQKKLGKFVYYVAFQNLHPKKQTGRNQWKPTRGFEWTEETNMVPDGVVLSRNCIPIARSIEP